MTTIKKSVVLLNLTYFFVDIKLVGKRERKIEVRKAKELFYKYYSIAFAVLPGIAGGLTLELQVFDIL